MNQSTIPHTEIGLRLTICAEFLLHEEKPIEEVYRSWMRRMGGRLIEFAEFEYWYRRFKNNQFDLGYDTSLDYKETSEIQNTVFPNAIEVQNVSAVIIEEKKPERAVERQIEDLKLNHQFNEKNVPKVFRNFIDRHPEYLKKISVEIYNQICVMEFDGVYICMKTEGNGCSIIYKNEKEAIRTDDPEKSIVDHLWIVLRNLKTEVYVFKMRSFLDSASDIHTTKHRNSRNLDSEKLNTLLQSMLHSIDHQFHFNVLYWYGFNEDTCLSMIKHVKPEKLGSFFFQISWKEEGNHQKMKELVETEQWKQANAIYASGVTPLKIQDLFQYERFSVEHDHISPEDVLLVTEHVFSSASDKSCILNARDEKVDINAIINVLRSQNDGSDITKTDPIYLFKYRYLIFKSGKWVFLNGCESLIIIGNFEETVFRTFKK